MDQITSSKTPIFSGNFETWGRSMSYHLINIISGNFRGFVNLSGSDIILCFFDALWQDFEDLEKLFWQYGHVIFSAWYTFHFAFASSSPGVNSRFILLIYRLKCLNDFMVFYSFFRVDRFYGYWGCRNIVRHGSTSSCCGFLGQRRNLGAPRALVQRRPKHYEMKLPSLGPQTTAKQRTSTVACLRPRWWDRCPGLLLGRRFREAPHKDCGWSNLGTAKFGDTRSRATRSLPPYGT